MRCMQFYTVFITVQDAALQWHTDKITHLSLYIIPYL